MLILSSIAFLSPLKRLFGLQARPLGCLRPPQLSHRYVTELVAHFYLIRVQYLYKMSRLYLLTSHCSQQNSNVRWLVRVTWWKCKIIVTENSYGLRDFILFHLFQDLRSLFRGTRRGTEMRQEKGGKRVEGKMGGQDTRQYRVTKGRRCI